MTFEEKVIATNEFLVDNFEDELSYFIFDNKNIINPFFNTSRDTRVNPVSYYGNSYLNWKSSLEDLKKKLFYFFC